MLLAYLLRTLSHFAHIFKLMPTWSLKYGRYFCLRYLIWHLCVIWWTCLVKLVLDNWRFRRSKNCHVIDRHIGLKLISLKILAVFTAKLILRLFHSRFVNQSCLNSFISFPIINFHFCLRIIIAWKFTVDKFLLCFKVQILYLTIHFNFLFFFYL